MTPKTKAQITINSIRKQIANRKKKVSRVNIDAKLNVETKILETRLEGQIKALEVKLEAQAERKRLSINKEIAVLDCRLRTLLEKEEKKNRAAKEREKREKEREEKKKRAYEEEKSGRKEKEEDNKKRKGRNPIKAELIAKACDIVGSKSELARLLGVSRQFVHSMTVDGNFFPATYAVKIDRLTDGQVRKEDLAPELYPDE